MRQIWIDGKKHDVLEERSRRYGWVTLLVRPEGAEVRGPHAAHSVSASWYDSRGNAGIRTGGHIYHLENPGAWLCAMVARAEPRQ